MNRDNPISTIDAAERLQRLEERLWSIGKKRHIIDVAQAHPNSRNAFQPMVEAIKVEVRQKLAGEVADGLGLSRFNGQVAKPPA